MKHVIILFILLFPFSTASADETEIDTLYEFSSVSEVLGFHPGSYIPEIGLLYLIEKFSLPWKIERDTTRAWGGWTVSSDVSSNCKYCILSFAAYGEWGQYGKAEYCLFDSTGHIYWKIDDSVVGIPRVSNNGDCALFTRPKDYDFRFDLSRDVVIKIIDLDGKIINSRTWNNHTSRAIQRGHFREEYMFTPDGRFFLSTMNIESKKPVKIKGRTFPDQYDHSELYIYDIVNGHEYSHYLGYFKPIEFLIDCKGNVVLTGTWTDYYDDYRYYRLGSYSISDDGKSIEKRVIKIMRQEL